MYNNNNNSRSVNPRFNLGGSGLEAGDFNEERKAPRVSAQDDVLSLGNESTIDDAPAFTLGDSAPPAVPSFPSLDQDSLSLGDTGADAGDTGSGFPGFQFSVAQEEEPVLVAFPSVPTFTPAPADESLSLGDEEEETDFALPEEPAPFSVFPHPPPVVETPVFPPAQPNLGSVAEDEVIDLGAGAPDEPSTGFPFQGQEPVIPVVDEQSSVSSVAVNAASPVADDVLSLGEDDEDGGVPVVPGFPGVSPAVAPFPSPEVPAPKPIVAAGGKFVNPLFADPDPVEREPQRQAVAPPPPSVPRRPNPLFDYKQEKDEEEFDELPAAAVLAGYVPHKNAPAALVGVSDTFDDEKKKKKKSNKSSSRSNKPGFQLQDRDITILRFLIKYQFSYTDALARLVNSTPNSIQNRLRILETHGLVKREVISVGSTLWLPRKAGIALCNMNFTERKKAVSFATIPHNIGIVNIAAELEREAPDAKDLLEVGRFLGDEFPVQNRFPGGVRLYGEDAEEVPLTWGEMTLSEREIRQAQQRYRGGRSSADMRALVEFAAQDPNAPELEPGNEGMFVVYGDGGATGEHVPDLVVTRPRDENGSPAHIAVELELTAKAPAEWKRILRAFKNNGQMYAHVYYFTPDKAISNMIQNANEDVGLENLYIRRYVPKNSRQMFKG